jgi:hypothetical protein
MSEQITQKLKEFTKDLLSEESLSEISAAIEEAVVARAKLQVEAALVTQDEDHANKVGILLEAIDQDHTNKLEKLVEAIDINHVDKLKNIISKYEVILSEEAKQFKNEMISTVSNYLDLYLEQSVPIDSIKEAAANKKARIMLHSLRDKLGVDMAIANESIKSAIVDGKKQIDEAAFYASKTQKRNQNLVSELHETRAQLLLEKKCTGLSAQKKRHLARVLGDKDEKFILENFDYTVSLFERGEEETTKVLKEQVLLTHKPADRPEPELLEENAQPNADGEFETPWRDSYMSELERF